MPVYRPVFHETYRNKNPHAQQGFIPTGIHPVAIHPLPRILTFPHSGGFQSNISQQQLWKLIPASWNTLLKTAVHKLLCSAGRRYVQLFLVMDKGERITELSM